MGLSINLQYPLTTENPKNVTLEQTRALTLLNSRLSTVRYVRSPLVRADRAVGNRG